MKLPPVTKVGPYRYRLVEHSGAIINDDGIALNGETCHQNLTIRIVDNLAPDAKASTVAHEVIHALLSLCGGNQILGDSEESFCLLLEAPLLSWLRDNKELVRWLQA